MKLRAEKIEKAYKGRKVVNGISLEVSRGEIVGLLGPNGAGKTTSFYMIVGLIKPNSGAIFLEDTEITKFPMYKRAQKGIGYLAQEASVFRKMSIEENILSVLQMTRLNKSEQIEKMESLITEFGLEHIRKNRGDLLSGGERRRTEIARALATDPKFVLLDEPFASLDAITRMELYIWLEQLKKYIKKSIILVTHDIDEAIFLSDKVIIMGSGKNNFRFQKDISMPHPRSSNINMSSEFLEIRKDLYCRLEEVR